MTKSSSLLGLSLWVSVAAFGAASTDGRAQTVRERLTADPMFQRCLGWMLDGNQGAFIQDVCLADFDIPPPSLFLCARKVATGFHSWSDQEGCAIVFEEQAKKVREGFVKEAK